MNERIFKTVSRAGSTNLAIGVIVLLTGTVTGILLIISGAKLIKRKYEITF